MRAPVLVGTIERRLLLTWRVEQELAADLVPEPFRPTLVGGWAMIGVCVIELRSRPNLTPRWLGLRSTSAAERIAVDLPNGRLGVYVPSRITSSRLLATLAGEHDHGDVSLCDRNGWLQARVVADGRSRLRAVGQLTDAWPADSVFATAETASRWYGACSVGCSPTGRPGRYRAVELQVPRWTTTPVEIDEIEVEHLDDGSRFPSGSIHFDHALAMHDLEHRWVLRPPVRASSTLRGG